SFNTAYGLPLVVTDERGIVTDYAYDGNGNLKTLTEAKGTGDQRITRYTYYSNGQRKTQTTGESTAGNTALATTTYNYDAYGNLTSEKDPLEKSTLYSSFDVLGNAWTITDRRSNVWTRTFDAAGNILTDKSPLDQGQTYSYTKAGDLLTIKAANNSITTLGANASGLPTTATYPNDEKLVLEWDKADRLTAVIDANDHTRNLAYDELGRLKTLTDGESNVTTYIYKNTLLSGIHYPTYQEERDYDKRERLTDSKEKANSLEYLRSRGYDQNGNLKNSLDANQKPTDYTYDKLNRITKTIDADSGETLFEYDARDNLLQVTDPEGRKTVYSYTLRDELETETKHDFIATSKQRQFQYDDNGNLTHIITPEQELTKYTYDIANRLDKSELFAHKDNEHPVKVVTYNHNTNDQYTGYSQSLGADSANRTADVIAHSETYVYNTLEQLESVTVDFGTFQKSFSYSYYPNGLKKTYTNPEGITYTYYYNGNNQIQALHIPSEGQMAWTDFKWRAPQSITLPGGNKAILGYDDLLQPKLQLLQDNADATIASADYQYGMESNILQITSEHGSYNFDYDELYRLDKATYPWGQTSGATAAPGGLAGFETFDYDGVGNRTEQGEADKADQPPAVATSGYNNHNQLSSTDNGLTYSYNDNGHTSQRLRSAESPLTHLPAITDYIYNHDERLIAVKHDGVTVAEFAYNPDGQRIKKTASGQTTWYLYNKEGLAAEYDASGALITEYHFKPYATWMTTPLFQRTAAGQVYYYQNDHLGTPQRMLAKSGAVVWEARYGAFGEASIITETVGNNLRFPGQYYDEETGLYYNYFRYYDPATGRYVTSDPIGLAGGLNTYAYVMGNPLRYIDPNGEAPLCPPGHRAVPLKNYENEFPNYFDCKPYADTGYRRDPGPFGQICGAEGSNAAYWIPDITPGACERHDKCYDDCAKRCAGDKCKQQCDFDLMTVGRNLPYGTATYFGGDDAYDNAKRKRGCSCDQ
ncbi:MAG: hypothetical protein GY934_08695, partial [Gammaproteobacteria bacterium]|nr:hypothetical protein [Gammaproteobacteria bacterium]